MRAAQMLTSLGVGSEAWYKINGQTPDGKLWDSVAGLYETSDDRFVRIHTNFPQWVDIIIMRSPLTFLVMLSHRRGLLDMLGLFDSPSLSRDEVTQAIRQWNSVDFETKAASRGMCATALRTFGEWDGHEHARSLSAVPPVSIHKIGEAPRRKLAASASRPLDGIRVLDLSRVLAGPIAGHTLAGKE